MLIMTSNVDLHLCQEALKITYITGRNLSSKMHKYQHVKPALTRYLLEPQIWVEVMGYFQSY